MDGLLMTHLLIGFPFELIERLAVAPFKIRWKFEAG